jgi:predicted permease
MNPFVKLSIAIYRRLAYAYPQEFQMVYGADVIRLGEEAVDDIWRRHGFLGLLRLIGDLAIRVPLEHLSELRQDVGYALRTLIKSPGLAIAGIVSLGLGIAVSTAGFSEINALIFHDLPGARDPKALVVIESPVSYPYFEQFRDQRQLFSGASAYMATVPFSVALEGSVNAKAERVFGHLVSTEYFQVLGVNAALGRALSPEDDKPGGPPVVMVSDRFWRTRLKADPHVVGRTLKINGQSVAVVGVGPQEFLGVWPIMPADLFVPLTVRGRLAPELSDGILQQRDARSFRALFRLAPGVTRQSAEAALETITRNLDRESVNAEQTEKNRAVNRVRLLSGGVLMPIRPEDLPAMLGFFAVLMGLILLIACTNLANMLLARAASRRKEFAIRLAVGASRSRLVRQLLTESVIIAAAGGVAGLLLAYWFTDWASKIKLPVDLPFQFDIHPDGNVLIFTFLLSAFVGVAFGLAPALAATRADVAPSLKEGSGQQQLRAYRKFGLRNLLVVWQVAGSLMLLLVTGFVVLGFSKSSTINLGLDTQHLYLLALDPVRDGYSTDQTSALFEKLPARLRNLAALRGAALSDTPPFSNLNASNMQAMAVGAGVDSSTMLKGSTRQAVGTGYFATIGIGVLQGREFNDHDLQSDAPKGAVIPMILNQTAAHELFATGDALGRRVNLKEQAYEVVGVVRDVQASLFSNAIAPAIYLPLTRLSLSRPSAGGITLLVNAAAGPDAIDAVRREVAAIDPDLNLFRVRSLDDQIAETASYLRIAVSTYGAMGVFALVLACVGLAGVTSYSVARRRKEIGIRVALGAKKSQVLLLVLREGSALVGVGTVLGFAGAFAMSKVLSSILNQLAEAMNTSVGNVALVAGAPVLLAGLAMIACYLPARRSAKIDPLTALREE